eukprot:6119014-Karenia_brevis.AAC.1
MPHIRVIVRAFESHLRQLLQPEDITALSNTEAPLLVLLRILPLLEQGEGGASAAASGASSSTGCLLYTSDAADDM